MSRVTYPVVLLAVPLLTCNALRATQNVTYGDIPLAIGVVLLLVGWLRYGHPHGVVPSGLAAGAFLLLATGLLAIVPADSAESLVPTLRFSLTLGIMPLLVMFAAPTPRRVERIVDAWLLAAGVNAVVAALDILRVTNIGTALTSVDWVRYTDRAAGLTLHPNHLGLVTAMALPVAIARLGAGGVRSLAAIGLVPLLIMGVTVSGSRGALMAAVAGVVLFFVFALSARGTRTTLLLFAAPVVSFVLMVTILGNNELTGSVTLERVGGGSGATQSNQARLLTIRESFDQAIEHPVVGEGFLVVRTAHNIYVQLLQAGGLLALVGFLAFAASIVQRARLLAVPSHGFPPSLRTLAAASGASVCVWLLFGMVGNAIYDRYLYIPVGMVLALGLVHQRCFAVIGSARPPQAERTPTVVADGFSRRLTHRLTAR